MSPVSADRSLRKEPAAASVGTPTDRLFQTAGIRFDLTGNCNLRCPYCVNDFSQIHSNVLMSAPAFEKAVRLLPLLAPDGELLFSCYFEPTLHPKFLDYLDQVPIGYRSRGAFTTNIGKPLKEDFFERLSRLALHHVNVSLDSLQPPVFEEMRKLAEFETFERNLNRLVDAFEKRPDSPELHFITVVSKRNLREIPDLVRKCAERFRPARHEVRCIWFTEEMERRDWLRRQALSFEDFLSLNALLVDAPSHVEFVYDLPHTAEAYTPFPHRRDSRFEEFSKALEDPVLRRSYSTPMSSVLLISSDGSLRFLIAEPEVRLNLSELDDPLATVRNMVFLQNLNVARSQLLRKTTEERLELNRLAELNRWLGQGRLRFQEGSAGAFGRLDDFRAESRRSGAGRPNRHVVTGWARNPVGGGPAREVILVLEGSGERAIVASQPPDRQRFDVVQALSDSELLYSGWSLEVKPHTLLDKFSGRFKISAYALDPAGRTAYSLDGAREADID